MLTLSYNCRARDIPWSVILSRAKFRYQIRIPPLFTLSLLHISTRIIYTLYHTPFPSSHYLSRLLILSIPYPDTIIIRHAIHHPIHTLGIGSLPIHRNQSHEPSRLLVDSCQGQRLPEQEAKDRYGLQVLSSTVSPFLTILRDASHQSRYSFPPPSPSYSTLTL